MAFAVAVFGVLSESVTRPNLFGQGLEDRREVAGVLSIYRALASII